MDSKSITTRLIRSLTLFTLIVLLIAGVGCGASAEEGAIAFRVVERDGVPHAINEGEHVWTDSAAAPLQFELEQTFGAAEEPEAALLGGVGDLVVDDNGVVYLLDGQNHRLVAFNPDGSLRWSDGRQGQGPGELDRAHSLVWDGTGHLYLVNQSGGRIDRWSTEGTFAESISTADFGVSFIRLVGFINDTLVATRAAMGGEPQRVYAIDTTAWTLEERFAIDLGLDLPEGLGTSASLRVRNGFVYAGLVGRYVLSRHSLVDGLQHRIIREVDYPVSPGVYTSTRGSGIMSFGSLYPVGRLSNGMLLAYVSWAANVEDPNAFARRHFTNDSAVDATYITALDLFDAEGRLLGSLRWEGGYTPSIGNPMFLSRDDKLYTYHSEPFPQVRRYDVSVTLEQ